MSFSVDATSGWAVPANSTEWTSFLSAANLAARSGPADLWGLQDTASPAADAIGAITLAGTGGTWSSALAGWTRKGWAIATAGQANRLLSTSASLPDPTTTSAMLLAYIAITTAPVATYQVMDACGGSATTGMYAEINASGNLIAVDATNTATGTKTYGTTVHPWIIKYDHTGSVMKLYTDLETIAPTFLAGSGKALTIGYVSTSSPAMWCGYAALWTGAAAEGWTDANISTLITNLMTPPTNLKMSRRNSVGFGVM